MDEIKEVDNVPKAMPTNSPSDYGNSKIDNNSPATVRVTTAALIIMQDEYHNSPPAANTCQRQQGSCDNAKTLFW
jgi:hypothetical protein